MRRSTTAPPVTLESFRGKDVYPVLSSSELVRILGLSGPITTIMELSGTRPDEFAAYYAPIIDRFLEMAQFQPASTTEHHSGLGGLAVHTIDVVVNALVERRAHSLPPGGNPEDISLQGGQWTYAVFVASMLHDAGKLLTLTRLVPTCNTPFSPLANTLNEIGAESYSIEWVSQEMVSGINDMYELQTRISIAMLTILPPSGLSLLGQRLEIIKQTTAYLSNLPYEWGVIGQIAQNADRFSVATNMRPGVSRDQVMSAPRKSNAAQMVAALRSAIKNMSMPINKNGAAAWVTNEDVWAVSKTCMDIIRKDIATHGISELPTDDWKLYGMLLDHGYLVPTPENQPVWNVTVSTGQYTHTLTMMRFRRGVLVHPSRDIKPFHGTIVPLKQDARPSLSKEDPILHVSPPATNTLNKTTSRINDDLDNASNDRPDHFTDESVDMHPPLSGDEQKHAVDLPVETLASSNINNTGPDKQSTSTQHVTAAMISTDTSTSDERPDPLEHASRTLNDIAQNSRKDITQSPVEPDHENFGRYFLTWLREYQDQNKIRKHSRVHIIKTDSNVDQDSGETLFAFLVWPAAAHDFMDLTGIEKSQDKELKKVINNKLRQSLKRQQLVVRREGKEDIWQAELPTRAGLVTTTIWGLLIPAWMLYDQEEMPQINTSIILRVGKYNINHRQRKPYQ